MIADPEAVPISTPKTPILDTKANEIPKATTAPTIVVMDMYFVLFVTWNAEPKLFDNAVNKALKSNKKM